MQIAHKSPHSVQQCKVMSLYAIICGQNSEMQYLQVALMSIRVMLTLHGAKATWSAASLSVTEPSSSCTRYSVGSKPMLMAEYDVKITQQNNTKNSVPHTYIDYLTQSVMTAVQRYLMIE